MYSKSIYFLTSVSIPSSITSHVFRVINILEKVKEGKLSSEFYTELRSNHFKLSIHRNYTNE
ncbi:unnamed protein product [Schistosoma curassoni]|uniref:Uncharacterized protein n=1 Tax=Schistosoma curassoni TaxID=6186 RepID=A0A183KXH3_9TREM|nr:unnamed protein product [Schistosoma curassoni]